MIPSSGLKERPHSLNVTICLPGRGEVKNPVRQIYVLVNNNTANVDYIKKQCEEELNINDVVLTTANGLLIEDSAGTRRLDITSAVTQIV